MELEFQTDSDLLHTQCPPKHYTDRDIDPVFRWTFDDIEDTRNFQSQYHKNPKRFQSMSDKNICEALALSMFDDLNGAKERFEEIAEDMGDRVYQVLGARIATGNIKETFGLNGSIGKHGHFNHHPAKDIPSKSTFQILEAERL